MSDDGSVASSYFSDDDETFEPLTLSKKPSNPNRSGDGELLDDFDEENDETEDTQYDEDETEDDDSDDENAQYQKITSEIKDNLLEKHYPEKKHKTHKEIEILAKVVRDKDGNILDEYHKTVPILTKYERTRVLGERTRQIQQGSPLFIENPDNIIDSYVLAEMELKQKKIPFIIQRPLPYGSSIEYWRLADLEIL